MVICWVNAALENRATQWVKRPFVGSIASLENGATQSVKRPFVGSMPRWKTGDAIGEMIVRCVEVAPDCIAPTDFA